MLTSDSQLLLTLPRPMDSDKTDKPISKLMRPRPNRSLSCKRVVADWAAKCV